MLITVVHKTLKIFDDRDCYSSKVKWKKINCCYVEGRGHVTHGSDHSRMQQRTKLRSFQKQLA